MRHLSHAADTAAWLHGRVTGRLQVDSRRVGAGDGFIAWPGFATDGRRHVGHARARGARACLVEAEGVDAFGFEGEDIATLAGLKSATGEIAAEYFGHPSRALSVLAVTGTNGKTSTAWWLAQALTRLPVPQRAAVIGTLGIGEPPHVAFNGLTTPDPVLLQETFRQCVDGGFSACAIEASSIGIAEGRLSGTRVRVALFTNFTQDHLDYHESMDAYWDAKARLFAWPGLEAAVVNVDDVRGAALAAGLTAGLDLWTYSAIGAARIAAEAIAQEPQGLAFDVVEAGERRRLATGLVGGYNVSNLLAVIGGLRALGVPLADAVAACDSLAPVPGRMERVPSGPGLPLVVVDYAHTPDALDKVLQALEPLAAERGGQLWCVFGCGGDRDPVKRPMMAAVAEKRAQRVIVTSDNPRGERPEAIVAQILLGFSRQGRAEVETDRARAIANAIVQAAAADVVLIAGKGHEHYQEIGGQRHPFSDIEKSQAALAQRAGEAA